MHKFVKSHGISLIIWIGIILISVISLPNIDQLVRSHAETKIPSSAQSQIANRIQSSGDMDKEHDTSGCHFNNGNKKLNADQKH